MWLPANIQGGIRLSGRRSTLQRTISLALVGTLAASPGLALAQGAPPGAPAPAASAPAPSTPNPAAAKAAMAAGDKAGKAKDWPTAVTQYQAAMDANASSQALEALANAQYQAKMQGEAYTSYDRLLKDYANAIGGHSKQTAQARLKELTPYTGFVSIRVNEAGADVQLDGKSIGPSPVAALIRVAAGPHRVDVSKNGFQPLSKTPNVGPNGKEIVDVQLQHEATTGHLVVSEKNGQPVRVLVDGSDVGAAPLDLEVAPGSHEVILRSATMASLPQTVSVDKGQSLPVQLEAVAASAHVEVTTSDRKGIIFLDGKPVAEGSYVADVAVGPHVIAVTRDGYDKFEKNVTLADKQNLSETVTLKLPEAKTSGDAESERTYNGIYGGLAAMALFEPGGQGSEVDTNCSGLAATSCATANPYGGGLSGWLGYQWNPFGLEAFFAGEFDESTPSATFNGATQNLENPAAVGLPHVEQFAFLRFGGMAALRGRVSVQAKRLRGSLAAGFGIAYKDMLFERDTKTNAGTENVYTDKSGHGYVSPALSIDLSVSLRVSPTTAIALGGMLWFETAGAGVESNSDPNQVAAASGSKVVTAIPTPGYHLATGAQTFIGPYLGVQFGP
jgi:hypothetical protein